MKIINISITIICGLFMKACANHRSENNQEKSSEKVDSIQLLDSLHPVAHTTELETRIYDGTLIVESHRKVEFQLTIYNYKYSGDGVYQLIKIKRHDNLQQLSNTNYGRVYTLRSDATNIDTVVYQLVPFDGSSLVNFLYLGNQLLHLNQKLERDNLELLTLFEN